MRKLLSGMAAMVAIVTAAPVTPAAEAAEGQAFGFTFDSIDGQPMPLAQWRGKVLLVVNTASFCGFTKQYAGLQRLWDKYEERGLVVIGVPSNDFGAQEPKGEGEIKSFCQGAFGITFPLTRKEPVVGDAAHPFYKWAAMAAGAKGAPSWNFHKYLIGRDGRLIAGFATRVDPEGAALTEAIEKALADPAPQS